MKPHVDHPLRIAPRRAGFTLIEIVGAFFLMVVVLVFMTGIFVENRRQRDAATAMMKERLSASSALALMAADLESAVLVTPAPGVDPGDHPWQFIADDDGEFGATSIRFVTQNAPIQNAFDHASGWVEVAYFLEEDEQGQLELWRWRSPRPPSEAPRGFPDSLDPGSARVAVGISDFGVQWLDSEGVWVNRWDSTYQPTSKMLPDAAEITISFFRAARRGELADESASDFSIVVPGLLQSRRVALVMRPLDVNALIELATGDGGLDCFTIQQCIDRGDSDWYVGAFEEACEGTDDELCEMLASPENTCWSTIENEYASLAASAPESCDS
jgi:type II secretory pathway component PulJ